MANFNKVLLLGNLTRDPEVRSTKTGTQVCKFGLAVNRKWKGQDGQMNESTCFVDLTAFGRQAEVIGQYCNKGRPVFIEGRLEFNSWTSQDGQKRNKLEVIVENFQLLGSGQQRNSGGGGHQQSGSAPIDEPGFAEDAAGEIPF